MKSRRNRIRPLETAPLTVKGRRIAWTADLRRLFDRRLAKVAEKHPEATVSVAASLEASNGSRVGNDKTCRVRLSLNKRGSIAVSASSSKAEAAVAKAIRRAETAFLRRRRVSRCRRNLRRTEADAA